MDSTTASQPCLRNLIAPLQIEFSTFLHDAYSVPLSTLCGSSEDTVNWLLPYDFMLRNSLYEISVSVSYDLYVSQLKGSLHRISTLFARSA